MKLRDIKVEREPLTPVEGAEGLFLADITLQKIEEMQSFGQEDSERDSTQVLLWMGRNLLRDENGEPFEDLQTPEAAGQLSFSLVSQIMQAVTKQMGAMASGNAPV